MEQEHGLRDIYNTSKRGKVSRNRCEQINSEPGYECRNTIKEFDETKDKVV
jgi:hypothetical protein